MASLGQLQAQAHNQHGPLSRKELHRDGLRRQIYDADIAWRYLRAQPVSMAVTQWQFQVYVAFISRFNATQKCQ